MEKRTRRYNLDEIKEIVRSRGIHVFTRIARENGLKMGLTHAQIIEVVLNLRASNLFKSMTTINDHTLWQDVYRAATPNGKIAYIKLTLQEGAVVIQFKEK